nr:MAG TPA: hypothetical protein [Bacteriophage sp.]
MNKYLSSAIYARCSRSKLHSIFRVRERLS